MEWYQFLTLMGTSIGCVLYTYKHIREEMHLMNEHHRDDIKSMDMKWEKLFERMDRKLEIMDSKWEKLVSRDLK